MGGIYYIFRYMLLGWTFYMKIHVGILSTVTI
jgi:hypothetical protein